MSRRWERRQCVLVAAVLAARAVAAAVVVEATAPGTFLAAVIVEGQLVAERQIHTHHHVVAIHERRSVFFSSLGIASMTAEQRT